MTNFAKIEGNEITFVDEYDPDILMLAEVFKDKELYNNRVDELSKSRNRKIFKMCIGRSYSIIIHTKVFGLPHDISKGISEFLSSREKLEFGRVSKELRKTIPKKELRKIKRALHKREAELNNQISVYEKKLAKLKMEKAKEAVRQKYSTVIGELNKVRERIHQIGLEMGIEKDQLIERRRKLDARSEEIRRIFRELPFLRTHEENLLRKIKAYDNIDERIRGGEIPEEERDNELREKEIYGGRQKLEESLNDVRMKISKIGG